MGMDLSTLRTPDENQLPENLPEMVLESPGYFHGVPYATLSAANILDLDMDFIDGPDWPPKGIKKNRAERLLRFYEPPADGDEPDSVGKAKPTFCELRVMQRYIDGANKALAMRSRKQGRVPAFKFASNDGWIVTPEECLIIACRLQYYLANGGAPAGEDDLEFIEGFAAFNELAAQYGGYAVW